MFTSNHNAKRPAGENVYSLHQAFSGGLNIATRWEHIEDSEENSGGSLMSNVDATCMKRVLAAAFSALMIISPTAVFAHGGGAHGAGHAHFSHKASTDKASKDNKDNANANGKNASDRDTGHARAEDRMNQHALANNHAGISDTDTTTGH